MKKEHVQYLAIFTAVILAALLVYAIVKQLEEFELQDDPKLHQLEAIFEEFFKQDRYWTEPLQALNKRDVMKDINLYKGNKSYTINKEKVFLCLKDEKGEYYSLNMLTYVLAHELAHVLCESIGHTEEFHEIFEALLVELTDAGVYDPTQPILVDYCKHGTDD